jgi:hypothetical protein
MATHVMLHTSRRFAQTSVERTLPRNEKTGKSVGSIASKGLKSPKSLTPNEIKTVSASVLTQRPDKSAKPKPKKK